MPKVKSPAPENAAGSLHTQSVCDQNLPLAAAGERTADHVPLFQFIDQLGSSIVADGQPPLKITDADFPLHDNDLGLDKVVG